MSLESDYMVKFDELIEEFWNSNYQRGSGTNHCHRCEFLMFSPSHTAMLKCKEYLKKQGKHRDEFLSCCDSCNKNLQIVFDDNGDFLFASSPYARYLAWKQRTN